MAQRKCPYCGCSIDNFDYCDYCGKPISTKAKKDDVQRQKEIEDIYHGKVSFDHINKNNHTNQFDGSKNEHQNEIEHKSNFSSLMDSLSSLSNKNDGTQPTQEEASRKIGLIIIAFVFFIIFLNLIFILF